MLNKLKWMLMLGLVSTVATAQDYDKEIFNRVKWGELCPRVLPVPLNNNKLQCEVSHPASSLHNQESFDLVSKQMPEAINCDYFENQYKTIIKPMVKNKGQEWKLCYAVFYTSYLDRVLNPTQYKETLATWQNKYFNSQTMR